MACAVGQGNMRGLTPATLSEAQALQVALREKVIIAPLRMPPAFIGAVDASFMRDAVVAVACLYSFPSLKHREDARCTEAVRFPYVPGFLTFREGHAMIRAVRKFTTSPGVVLVDGHGIAHPKGIGIASHIGVVLGIPTIGCAKSRLVGNFDEPAAKKGSWRYLFFEGVPVGAVVRTRDNVKPVFVSPGHLTDIPSSVEVVMTCAGQYRIPEPLRRADRISRKLSREDDVEAC